MSLFYFLAFLENLAREVKGMVTQSNQVLSPTVQPNESFWICQAAIRSPDVLKCTRSFHPFTPQIISSTFKIEKHFQFCIPTDVIEEIQSL